MSAVVYWVDSLVTSHLICFFFRVGNLSFSFYFNCQRWKYGRVTKFSKAGDLQLVLL